MGYMVVWGPRLRSDMSLSPTTRGPTYKQLELLNQVLISTKRLNCYFYRKQVYDYSVDDDKLLKMVLNRLRS